MNLRNNKISLVWAVLLLMLSVPLPAQKHLSNPYSRFGLGEMQQRTSQRNRTLGGAALAYRDPVVVNSSNPASYTAFDSLSAVVDAAVSFGTHRLVEASKSQSGSTIFMDYLSIGLPVSSWWATAFGIRPFSVVSYNYSYENAGYCSNDWGEGGVNEIFWGNAFQLFSRLSAGFQFSYLFGTSYRAHELVFSDEEALNLRAMEESQLKGFMLSTGIQYEQPVGRSLLGFGLAFTPSIPSFVHMNSDAYYLTYQLSSSLETPADTLVWDEKERNLRNRQVRLPSMAGFGISLSKPGKYWVGADMEWEGWSRFSVDGAADSLHDSWRISLGANWVPNASAAQYLKRVTYQFGLFYRQDEVCFNQMPLRRTGMALGMDFPMRKNMSRIGVSLESGLYGPASGGIREQYYRIALHVQLHEKWYQHRKLE